MRQHRACCWLAPPHPLPTLGLAVVLIKYLSTQLTSPKQKLRGTRLPRVCSMALIPSPRTSAQPARSRQKQMEREGVTESQQTKPWGRDLANRLHFVYLSESCSKEAESGVRGWPQAHSWKKAQWEVAVSSEPRGAVRGRRGTGGAFTMVFVSSPLAPVLFHTHPPRIFNILKRISQPPGRQNPTGLGKNAWLVCTPWTHSPGTTNRTEKSEQQRYKHRRGQENNRRRRWWPGLKRVDLWGQRGHLSATTATAMGEAGFPPHLPRFPCF